MHGIRTLAIIKPDAIAAGHAYAIANRIRSEQFIIRATTRITLSDKEIGALYGASKGKPWYPKHAAFMASGPCDVLVLERTNAVDHWRRVIGATDPRRAETGTIRAMFGDQNQEPGHCYRNAVHGSDTDEAAEREIGIFFGVDQQTPRDRRDNGLRCKAGDVADCGCSGADCWQSDVWCPDPRYVTKAPHASTLAGVAAEVQRARRKFPSGRFLLAALVEEVGELAGAIATGNAEEAYTEAIQVAAVAVRIAEEGERTRYQMDRVIQAVVALGMGVRFLLQRNAIDAKASFGIAANAARRIQESGDSTFDDLTDEEAKP